MQFFPFISLFGWCDSVGAWFARLVEKEKYGGKKQQAEQRLKTFIR